MEIKVDRRVKRTRQALQNAYVDLIEQYTHEEITVSMIAQQADLNRATFYAHYSNKEEFLEESLGELLEGFRAALLVPFEKKERINVNSLAPTTVQIFDFVERNNRAFYALYTSHPDFEKRLKELFLDIFSNDILIETDPALGPADYEIFLYYQSSATLGLIFYWIKGKFAHSAEFMMEQLTVLSNTQAVDLKRK